MEITIEVVLAWVGVLLVTAFLTGLLTAGVVCVAHIALRQLVSRQAARWVCTFWNAVGITVSGMAFLLVTSIGLLALVLPWQYTLAVLFGAVAGLALSSAVSFWISFHRLERNKACLAYDFRLRRL